MILLRIHLKEREEEKEDEEKTTHSKSSDIDK